MLRCRSDVGLITAVLDCGKTNVCLRLLASCFVPITNYTCFCVGTTIWSVWYTLSVVPISKIAVNGSFLLLLLPVSQWAEFWVAGTPLMAFCLFGTCWDRVSLVAADEICWHPWQEWKRWCWWGLNANWPHSTVFPGVFGRYLATVLRSKSGTWNKTRMVLSWRQLITGSVKDAPFLLFMRCNDSYDKPCVYRW